jgi:diguanylate cyclase (GGDEF)-like protein
MAGGDRHSTTPDAQPSVAHGARVEPLAGEVHRLGQELEGRIEEVVQRTSARSRKAGAQFDAATRESFERIGRDSTAAVARWLAGGSPEEGRETSRKTFETYGQLAAQRLAPLNEVTKRCLRWRDAVSDVLRESADALGVSPAALNHAVTMVQRTLDITLVRVCECFEIERQRTDEELARRQEELAYMASHDALTQLPNRTSILDRCTQALTRARRHQVPIAALFIDVDNFKCINDTHGHDVGDELLQLLAARLDGVIRDADALGRLGGDEFVVIAEGLGLTAEPEMIAERLREALKEPFTLGEHSKTELQVTASIGIAVGRHASAEELLTNADQAMYRAKLDGKDRYVAYEPAMSPSPNPSAAVQVLDA